MTRDEFLNVFNGSVELVSEDYPESVFFYYTINTERFYKLNIISDNIVERDDDYEYYEDYDLSNKKLEPENILFEVMHDKKLIWINEIIYKQFNEDKYYLNEDLILRELKNWDKIYEDIKNWLDTTIAKGYKITNKQYF